jgi:hypothetical protein
MPDETTTQFPKKYAKKLPQEFSDAVNAMSEEEIKARIITCEQHLYEIEGSLANDDKLQALKEEAKLAAAPYKDSKSEETAKIKYCLFVLEGRGVVV